LATGRGGKDVLDRFECHGLVDQSLRRCFVDKLHDRTRYRHMPRAVTGNTRSTTPLRTPTYQSWMFTVGSQWPGTSLSFSPSLRASFGSLMTPCSSEAPTYSTSSRPNTTATPESTLCAFRPSSQMALPFFAVLITVA